MTVPDGEALPGGNSGSRVVHDGGFIVKDATPSTDAVHRYLGALLQAGIDVPLPHGRDGAGRQLLEFIDGTPAMAVPQLDHAALRRIGALVALFTMRASPLRFLLALNGQARSLPPALS